MPKNRILVSVTDKSGLSKLAPLAQKFDIRSTGGTAKALLAAGVHCSLIEDMTGFPEMLDGRLKTLHPAVHGGILAERDKPEHMAMLAQHGIVPVDAVFVNLYPFLKKQEIENIDIGGPTMLRGAAKNWQYVLPIMCPNEYDQAVAHLMSDSPIPRSYRWQMATSVFCEMAIYETEILRWMRDTPQA